MRARRRGRAGAVVGLSTLLTLPMGSLGCWAVYHKDRDIDRTPIVTTGAGASIIYPGQSPPVYQGPYHPKESGRSSYATPGSATPQAGSGSSTWSSGPGGERTSGQSSGAPAAGGGGITMLGGNTTEETRHQKIDEKPLWWKYAALPFAVVIAPFAYAADKLRGEPKPGPEVPTLEQATKPAPPSGPPPSDYETTQMKRLEAELDRRKAASAPPPEATPAGGAPAADSLAAELAALRSRPKAPSRSEATAPPQVAAASRPTPTPTPAPAPVAPGHPEQAAPAVASGQVDRDGDGRTDEWIYRKGGDIVREELDEDYDGRPDRTIHYDPSTHQISAIEEDANHDGRIDTWTTVRNGAIVRRRADGDGDGRVDTWSYYRHGVLTRMERDSTGDGFRDHVSYYVDGRLAREEQDDDADGFADAVKYYDAQERLERVEEDTNADGKIDVISHYQNGRLTRRELLDPSALRPSPSLTGLD